MTSIGILTIQSLLLTGFGMSIFSELDFETHISTRQLPSSCGVIVFTHEATSVDFKPLERPTLLYSTNHPTKELPETSILCNILVILGLQPEKLTSYDTFVRMNFRRINLILIFPLVKFNIYEFRYFPWKSIWHHDLMVIDHMSEKILFESGTTCKYENPVCVLKGMVVKIGFTGASPYLHIHNWEDYKRKNISYPKTTFSPSTPESQFNVLGGVEGQLLRHLVLEYQMQLTMIAPPDMVFGIKTVDNNWTGKFGQLMRGDVDLIVGLIAGTWERSELGVYLAPLYNVKFSLMSRKNPPQISWTAPFSIFSGLVWIALSGSLIAIAVFMWCLRITEQLLKKVSKEKIIKEVWGSDIMLKLVMASLKQPLVKAPRGAEALTFLSWSLVFMILATIYSSLLTAELSVPDAEKAVDTMKDVWESRKTLIVFARGTVDLYITTAKFRYTKLVRDHNLRYTSTFPNYSLAVFDDPRFVSPIEEEAFKYKITAGIGVQGRKVEDYHISKQPLINVFCSWLASQQLRVAPAMHTAMLRAQEMGLLQKWSTDRLKLDGNKSISRSEKSSLRSETVQMTLDNGDVALDMDNTKGIFFVWIVGVIFSLLVFSLEIVIGYKSKTNKQIVVQCNGLLSSRCT